MSPEERRKKSRAIELDDREQTALYSRTALGTYAIGRGFRVLSLGADGAVREDYEALPFGFYFHSQLRAGAKYPERHSDPNYEVIPTGAAEVTAFQDMATVKRTYTEVRNPRYVEPSPAKSFFSRFFGEPPASELSAEPKTITEIREEVYPMEHPLGGRACRWTYAIPNPDLYGASRSGDDDSVLLDGGLTYKVLKNAGGIHAPNTDEAVTTILTKRVAEDLLELTLRKPPVSRLIAGRIAIRCVEGGGRQSLLVH